MFKMLAIYIFKDCLRNTKENFYKKYSHFWLGNQKIVQNYVWYETEIYAFDCNVFSI